MGFTLPKRCIRSFTFAPSVSLTMSKMFFAFTPSCPMFIFFPLCFPQPHPSASLSFQPMAFESPPNLLSLRKQHPHPPLSLPLCSPRFNASNEQNSAHHGEGWRALLKRLLHHAHVLPIPLLHPDGEVCAQPPHLHQQ